MKKNIKFGIYLVLFITLISSIESCKKQSKTSKEIALISKTPEVVTLPKKTISEEFKNYWYASDAEITSYKLEQARYGEIHEGEAVLIYVTEPFVKEKQVKADRNYPDNIPVLKLNTTKKFLTGIYPYSIMNSTFYSVHDNQHALKVSFSAQEWCGHVYAQLNNKDKFEIQSRSYFESEADTDIVIGKTILENELWNKIRINPKELPVGAIKIIPSLEHIRMSHIELKSYDATASLTSQNNIKTYTLFYPELERTLRIHFTSSFPYMIESWSESYKSGFGSTAKVLKSTATKIKTMKTPYWKQNRNKHLHLRDTLGL